MRGLFVTGTGTGVGKTIVSAALLASMTAAGEAVRAHKPAVTGLSEPPGEWPPDHELLAAAAAMSAEQVAPLRFEPAVSPHLAAALVGEPIDPREVIERARAAGAPTGSSHETALPAGSETASPTRSETALPAGSETASPTRSETALPAGSETASPTRSETELPAGSGTAPATGCETELPAGSGTAPPTGGKTEPPADSGPVLIVEGIGGLLVPLAENFTIRDLAKELALPLILAATPGLGTINHTMLALEAARSAGLEVRAVVLTPWPAEPSELERSNHDTIARLGEIEVATLGEIASPDLAELAAAGSRLPWQRWLR